MKKVFSLLILLILLNGCGNKENATGGPEDTEKPEIINVYPPQYEDISGRQLEITFSKPMDYASFSVGMRIFPEIHAKRYRWDENTLIIEINQELEPNTNYLFSFSEKIRCHHNNPLDKQYDIIWANGALNDFKVSGEFSFEDMLDSSKEVLVSLFTADSSLVTSRSFTDRYTFEALNKSGHFLRAYIDLNKDKRLDIEREPFAEAQVPAKPVVTRNLFLAYSDSTAPQLKRVRPIFSDELDLEYSEELTSLQTIQIYTDSLNIAQQIKRWRIAGKMVKVFSSNLDTLDYKLFSIGATDKKGNKAALDSLDFKGITKLDTIPPKVIKVDPRDGSSVTSLRPQIKVTFSEVIFKESASAWLIETETGAKFALKTSSGDSETLTFEPLFDLNNFNSYRLMIEAQDPRGNILSGFDGSVFLPIVRQEIKE